LKVLPVERVKTTVSGEPRRNPVLKQGSGIRFRIVAMIVTELVTEGTFARGEYADRVDR
jgi:hypothetical protein